MKSDGIVLPSLSALYGAAVRTRLAAYSRGLLSTSRLPKPVISVGNITAGGTGKTPLVEWICKAVAHDSRKVCVLSRGYRRERPNHRILVSDGETILAEERAAGDEPFLLAKNLLGVAAVVCDANRFAAGSWAIKNLGTDLFVLDDGFQHLQLQRDLDILVIDGTDPWGGGALLPTGRLREPVSAAARADCILITRIDQVSDIDALTNHIDRLTSHRPIFTSTMQASRCLSLKADANELNSKTPIAAFCGVGNPRAFFRQLRDTGYKVIHTQEFPDHHNYAQSDVQKLAEAASSRGASALVTTAKDAVKLSAVYIPMPCYVIEIEIQIDKENLFRKLLHDAVAKLKS
jgi:tetraacyldisaccharide 4'-kinase